MDLGERRVARSNHGDGAICYERAARVLDAGEVSRAAEGFESFEHIGPGFVAGCFHVNEEEDGLRAVAVEDAVVRWGLDKWRGWVFMHEDGEDGLDVEGFKGARVCEG